MTGEVIVPAFTFPATAQALVLGRPDAGVLRRRPATYNLSVEQVRRR